MEKFIYTVPKNNDITGTLILGYFKCISECKERETDHIHEQRNYNYTLKQLILSNIYSANCAKNISSLTSQHRNFP